MADYLEQSLVSIKQACDLVDGETLELNINLCKHLVQALIETQSVLHERFDELTKVYDVSDERRVVLLQLYSVVKQAEALVLKCCENQSSTWPERALALLGFKEYILDIVLHLRWWERILDIAIASTVHTSSSQMSEIERLKSANQKFEETLETLARSNELQQADDLDKEHLEQKIEELQASYTGEAGPKERQAYLLSIQVHSLLNNKEVPSWIRSALNPRGNELRVIGHGSFGVVLQVEWCGLDCALKIVNKVVNDRNEAESLKRCRHPHIVQCFDYWEEVKDANTHDAVTSDGNVPDTPVQSHILMERMPSDLLRHMLAVKSRKASSSCVFSMPVAVDVMLQVSKAMWHMHNKNNIHRDLKPGNVLMGPVKEVRELCDQGFLQIKLADFGLARGDMMSSNDANLTPNAGTTVYRAPELSLPEYTSGHNYPHKADVWSFGIMGAEILSGVRTFPKNFTQNEKRVSMKNLPKDCPDYLKVCLESCWKDEPTSRPSFSEIWKMLRFAKLRSLGIIHDNYDLFSYSPSRGPRPPSRIEPRQPPPKEPTPLSPKEPTPPSPKEPTPTPVVTQKQPTRLPGEKKIDFWAWILLKLRFNRRTASQDPSAHLQSSFQTELNFLVNQVWPPEDSTEKISSNTPGIDVIFFEGNVGGRPMLSCRDTWLQRKKPNAWWPQDWSPHDVENVRVLVLEYSISDKGLEAVVNDLKRLLIFRENLNLNYTWQRPIVLVGHSLGCTVIQTLVADLHQSVEQFDSESASDHDLRKAETSRAFLKSLAGCFFYAPPCTGLVRSDPDLLKFVFGGLTYSDELFQNLRELSVKTFLDISKSRNIRLMALIEGRRTKARFVVPESSIQGLDIEYLKLEDSNHSEVCKPVDKNHDSYVKLVQFIADCAKIEKLPNCDEA